MDPQAVPLENLTSPVSVDNLTNRFGKKKFQTPAKPSGGGPLRLKGEFSGSYINQT
jgi:hypothetical protein